MTPYQPRPIRFLGLWPMDGWRVKVYGIAHARPLPRPELVAAAKAVAARRLRALPPALPHYRVGFLGVHDGRTANFVFLDVWADENELYHHAYVSPTAEPGRLTYVTPTGLSACVWDMRLQAFERDAWVTHVLRRDPSPDLDGYLADTLDADV